MPIDWKELAESVRVARARVKMSQKDAAKEIGVTGPTLCRLENGKSITADNYVLVQEWLDRP